MPESARFEDLARGALAEITPASEVGEYLGEVDEGDGVVSVLFAPTMPGYPGWKWTVSIAQVDDAEPTVLEAELMPAEGALLSPDWVPWADRLAEYKASQEALGADAGVESDDEDDPDDDDDVDDEDSDDEDDDLDDDDDDDDDDDLDDHVMDDDDVLGSDVLHGGDLDGVDIDEHVDDESDDEPDEDDDVFDLDDDEGDDRSY